MRFERANPDQKSALFIRRNRDFGDVLLLDRSVFFSRDVTGYPRNQEYGLAEYLFTLRAKPRLRSDCIKGQVAPGHRDDTLAACLERIAVFALVGIANLLDGLLSLTPSTIYSSPWTISAAVRKTGGSEPRLPKGIQKAHPVQNASLAPLDSICNLGLSLDSVWRGLGLLGPWADGLLEQPLNAANVITRK